jgi:cyclase
MVTDCAMLLPRVIARLDIKGPNLIKGICFEGLRVIGKPEDYARKYADEGAHELLYIDSVSSLYGRPQFASLLERTADCVFVPITVAGGIQSVADVRRLLEAGADKVAVNTAAIRNPKLISDIAERCGSQAITVSIEAKRTPAGWEAYVENGRERTGRDAVQWAREAVERGAGEILLTSVDRDGTRKGFDLELISAVAEVSVQVVASGGMGTVQDARQAMAAGASAVAFASALHYGNVTVKEVADGIAQGFVSSEAGSGRGTDARPEGRISQEGA